MNQKKVKALLSSSVFLNIRPNLIIFLFWFCSISAFGQNYRCIQVSSEKRVLLDSIGVEPGSISISPVTDFVLEKDGKTLSITNDTKPGDTLEICFRSVTPYFKKPIYSRHINEYNRSIIPQSNTVIGISSKNDSFFDMGALNTNGAISRGITVGNQQSVFVNSTLNLQIEGQITDDLKISAVITDQNIPYQPEGNTQQIRDFDNVYIQLYNDKFNLRAGDIVLQNPIGNSYFLKYYKNVQGLQLTYDHQLKNEWKSQSQVSASLSKGQFASVVIESIDGVQGPYKLRGSNGERFIVILANSEKVFLDGKLLKRGFDQDYVIDYNLGEITFSPNTIITRFSRIRVDYEFANQNYSRSNLSASQLIQKKNTRFYFNYYREKDNRSNALGFSISPEDQMLLRLLGDENGTAVISGVDSTGYQENALLYSLKDTILNGEQMKYYLFDPDNGTYQISFTSVSDGQYVLSSETTNGKVYEWVGAGLGAYDPVRVISLPNQKQMIVLGADHLLNEYEQIYQEIAFSQQDQNLFSLLDDQDNQGWAWKGGIRSLNRPIGMLENYKFTGDLNVEFDQNQFRSIDRFRDVDYDRSWNYDVYSDSTLMRSDFILSSQLGLRKDHLNAFSYQFSSRNRTDVIQGNQHGLTVRQQIGQLNFSSVNSFSINDLSATSRSWLKSEQQIEWNHKWVSPGYIYTLDQQKTESNLTHEIISTQMHYQSHNWYLQSGDSLKSVYRLDYIRRSDQLPQNGELTSYTDAQEMKLSYNGKVKSHQVGVQMNYRTVTDHLNSEQTDNQLLGKLNWRGGFLKQHIKTNLTYSSASVRELKRTYVYINVPTGQGTHTWRDENEDGIQDINEFYEAVNVDEKNYVKIFTPTDEYVNAFQTILVQTVDIKLPDQWMSSGWFLNQMSKISFNGNVKSNFKTSSQVFGDRLNPWIFNLKTPDIVSARNNYRGTAFFNRNGQGVSLETSMIRQDSKSLLSGGFELRSISGWESGYRWSLSKTFSVRGNYSQKENSNSSDFLSSRNFNLRERGIDNQIVWQPGNSFRLIGGLEWRNKRNLFVSSEWSDIREISGEMTWMQSSKSNFNVNLSWLEIGFSGEQNSYVGYELLEALQPGTNQKWNINWQQSLKKGLQLTLQYYGRKSESSAVIHTGNMMMTAFF